MLHYNRANRQVAILCNHQRTVPKAHSTQMEKLTKLVDDLEAERKKLKLRLRHLKAGRPIPKSSSESEGETNEDGTPKKRKKVLPTEPEKIKKALEKLEERIKNRRVEMESKDENKTVALGTSKINYMDPRITAAWCKKNDVRLAASTAAIAAAGSCVDVRGDFVRFRSSASSRRRCGRSSPGPWTSTRISSTSLAPAARPAARAVARSPSPLLRRALSIHTCSFTPRRRRRLAKHKITFRRICGFVWAIQHKRGCAVQLRGARQGRERRASLPRLATARAAVLCTVCHRRVGSGRRAMATTTSTSSAGKEPPLPAPSKQATYQSKAKQNTYVHLLAGAYVPPLFLSLFCTLFKI